MHTRCLGYDIVRCNKEILVSITIWIRANDDLTSHGYHLNNKLLHFNNLIPMGNNWSGHRNERNLYFQYDHPRLLGGFPLWRFVQGHVAWMGKIIYGRIRHIFRVCYQQCYAWMLSSLGYRVPCFVLSLSKFLKWLCLTSCHHEYVQLHLCDPPRI